MVASVDEFIDRARSRLDDEIGEANGSETLWSDDDMEEYTNDAERALVRETRMFKDSTTATITDITWPADTRAIAYSPLILEIESVFWVEDGQTREREIFPESVRDIRHRKGSNWRTQSSSRPHNYILDESEGFMILVNIPTLSGVIKMIVDRLPLEPASILWVFTGRKSKRNF